MTVFKKKKKKSNNTKETSLDSEIENGNVSDGRSEGVNPQDQYARVMADFQNYKRRVEKERSLWIQQAQIDVLLPVLTIADDIDRAVESCRKQGEELDFLKGLELIQKNMKKVLMDLGVEEIGCEDKSFNPDLHEALLEVDSADHAKGEIVEVISKGYTLKRGSDLHVLRHSKVSVAK